MSKERERIAAEKKPLISFVTPSLLNINPWSLVSASPKSLSAIPRISFPTSARCSETFCQRPLHNKIEHKEGKCVTCLAEG